MSAAVFASLGELPSVWSCGGEKKSGRNCQLLFVLPFMFFAFSLSSPHLHFRHLPMHSTYSFCEMDLKGLLSRATLDKFSQEIHRNRQRRKRREQLERKAELEVSPLTRT